MTSELFAALKAWIVAALPTVNKVIESEQARGDAPRPAKPYVVLKISTDTATGGTTSHKTTATEGTVDPVKVQQVHTMPRRLTLVVDIYGETALQLMRDLEISVNFPDVIEMFRVGGLAVTHAGGIGDTTRLRSTGYEPSAQLEFYVNQNQQATVEVPWIETVVPDITYEEAV